MYNSGLLAAVSCQLSAVINQAIHQLVPDTATLIISQKVSLGLISCLGLAK